jgi:malate dehydrogenase
VSKIQKVSVIGAGNVGATLAQRLFDQGYADVALVDIIPDMPQGKALDILESGPQVGSDASIVGSNGYEETASSDVVVVTAGVPRKPGMSRDDLLFTNADIVGGVVKEVAALSPEAVLVVVSNPLDAMVYVALQASGFPKSRVMGMAGVLDTARFCTFIAGELGVSIRDVQATVLGSHGDAMVPLLSNTTVGGVPLQQLLPQSRIAELVQRTQDGGAEIVGLLKTGSAFYAPSAAIAEMVDSILLDRGRVLPCCVYLDGEYGLKDVCLGVPVKLGAEGVQKVVEMELTPEEQAALGKSAEAVRELIKTLASRETGVGGE